MFMRACTSCRGVNRIQACRFDRPISASHSLRAYIPAAGHRLFSSSDTMAAEAPRLNCMGKPVDAPEATNSVVRPVSNAEKQARVRELMSASSGNSWDECWKEGMTPWDVGGVTPVIQHLVEQGELPQGRALVPGCGSGYDVLALASEFRQVVGLDISETASSQAKKNAEQHPRGKWVQFIVDDFFTYTPESPFNLIFDYTFFCALEPELRPKWASKMAELLSSDGELLTLMFPIDDFAGGPPFALSVEAYEKVLIPQGLMLVSCEENEFSVPARKGKEKIARWKKSSSKM
ncbi:methyl halide transferase [Marchantia polymorpha subsp. ruderalis]